MADSTLFKTILCPVDFSEHSRQALAYAALLASRSGGRLVVIFVEDPLLAAAATVAYDEKALTDKARKELRCLERDCCIVTLSVRDMARAVPRAVVPNRSKSRQRARTRPQRA